MAMIDYGAIVFKNGKLVTTEMFTPMKEAVGWEDTKDDRYVPEPWLIKEEDQDRYARPLSIKDNYFAYIGDKENTICFYKTSAFFVHKNDNEQFYECDDISFGLLDFTWSSFNTWFDGDVKVVIRNGYFILKWNYKDDKYKVYFGYGVDINAYKKWRIVNYYRSVPFYFSKVAYRIETFVKRFGG